jgi:hypothetical protein
MVATMIARTIATSVFSDPTEFSVTTGSAQCLIERAQSALPYFAPWRKRASYTSLASIRHGRSWPRSSPVELCSDRMPAQQYRFRL